jgi:WD40 repeat protein
MRSTAMPKPSTWSLGRLALASFVLALGLGGCETAMQPKETPLQAYRGDVATLAWTPDGKSLATTCSSHVRDGTLTIWDIATGKKVVTLKAHDDFAVFAIAFSPKGERMATASVGKSLKLWDAATWKEIASWEDESGARQLQFINGGKQLVFASFRGVEVREVQGNKLVRRFRDPALESPTCTHRFSLSPDMKELVSVDQEIRYWDFATGKLLASVEAHALKHNEGIFDVAHSLDGKQIVTVGVDQTMRLWDTKTRKEIAQVAGLYGNPNRVAFSPDGRTVAVATGIGRDSGGWVYLWRMNGKKPFEEQRLLKKHDTGVRALAFSPDSRTLATSSQVDNGRIVLIDVEKEFQDK